MQRSYVRAQLWVGRVRDRLLDERGATAVEYALMLAFIAGVIIFSVTLLGKSTDNAFSKVTFP
jgi:Flp pilus assembly pilin Flp